jgi:hypothetical protein
VSDGHGCSRCLNTTNALRLVPPTLRTCSSRRDRPQRSETSSPPRLQSAVERRITTAQNSGPTRAVEAHRTAHPGQVYVPLFGRVEGPPDERRRSTVGVISTNAVVCPQCDRDVSGLRAIRSLASGIKRDWIASRAEVSVRVWLSGCGSNSCEGYPSRVVGKVEPDVGVPGRSIRARVRRLLLDPSVDGD